MNEMVRRAQERLHQESQQANDQMKILETTAKNCELPIRTQKTRIDALEIG